jgi:AcrR family transcriptional regulator
MTGMTTVIRSFDPRQVRTRVRVFAAARRVLRREGLGATTMDAIAAEAGVARSTLYRNWSGRDELLAQAFDEMIGAAPRLDPAADVTSNLRRVLRGLARALHDTEWGATLPAVVAVIESSPELATRYGRLTAERRAALVDIAAAAVQAGQLPRSMVVDELIDALVGPLFYRRLILQIRTSPQWIARHVDRTLTAFQS